jgi:hypothetical protein
MNIKKALLVSLLQLQASWGFAQLSPPFPIAEKALREELIQQRKELSSRNLEPNQCLPALFKKVVDSSTKESMLVNKHTVLGVSQVEPEKDAKGSQLYVRIVKWRNKTTLHFLPRNEKGSLCVDKDSFIEIFFFGRKEPLILPHEGEAHCSSVVGVSVSLSPSLVGDFSHTPIFLIRFKNKDMKRTYSVLSLEEDFISLLQKPMPYELRYSSDLEKDTFLDIYRNEMTKNTTSELFLKALYCISAVSLSEELEDRRKQLEDKRKKKTEEELYED